RWLDYPTMLAVIQAEMDSVAGAAEDRARHELFASVTELGMLETQLDHTDQMIAAQRARLGMLEEDFTGVQRAALLIVASGAPASGAPDSIAITLEDGARLAVGLSAEQRASLAHGGVVQVFHGFVEPREQVVQIGFVGAGWPADESGFVTVEPPRDQLQLLRFDLSAGAAGAPARTRLPDPTPPRRGRATPGMPAPP